MLLSPPRRIDDRRRRLVAAWFTLTLLACLVCLAGVLPEPPSAPLSTAPPRMAWPDVEVWLPPTAQGGSHAAARATRTTTPRPAATEAAPAVATPPADDAAASAPPVANEAVSGVGQHEGDGGGSGSGDGDGLGLGDGPGTGSGAPLSVHWSEAVPVHRAVPEWPQAALSLGLHEARCVAHVVMDERGEPVSVDVRGCPSVFWSATRDAALDWRWEPFESGGQALRVQFDIAFEYRR